MPPLAQDYHFGYVPNPRATAAFDEQIPKAYGENLNALPYDLKRSAFPYRLLSRFYRGNPRRIRNGRLTSRNQSLIGSCVGHGGAGAARQTIVGDILLRGDPERVPLHDNELVDVSPSACYGLSRMAGNALGAWQGSNGSWMTNALIKYGVPYEIKTDRYNLSEYTVADAAAFQRGGVPGVILEDIKQSTFGAYARVTEPEQAVAGAQNAYGMHLCCGLGFSSTRDADGFSRQSGSWAHCQIIGCCYVYYESFGARPARRGIGVWNSWGDNWNGGGLGGQTPDLPWGAYIWDYDDFARRLDNGSLEIYIMGGHRGLLRSPFDYSMAT
jgi:hypothetical protein